MSKNRGRGNLIRGILSGFLLLYLCFAFLITDYIKANSHIGKVNVSIISSDSQNFITPENALSELGTIPTDSDYVNDINLSAMEHSLKSLVNIETAEVARTVKGNIDIQIRPMIPVARVFDNTGLSYYVNRSGKKLRADIKYHADVPIIYGNIKDSGVSAKNLLPILQYIANDSVLNGLTSALKVDKNNDVLLIPEIKGHIVNLGDCNDKNIDDKFYRLLKMYRDVIPYKGWLFYDTISVKYTGQVVATRSKKKGYIPDLLYELEDSEEDDPDMMNIGVTQE